MMSTRLIEEPVYDYPDLFGRFGWKAGIHKAPAGYQHPWLVVTTRGTMGAWTRENARQLWRDHR